MCYIIVAVCLPVCYQSEIAAWLAFHKRKWAFQARQRHDRHKRRRIADRGDGDGNDLGGGGGVVRMGSAASGMGSFLRRTTRTMMDQPWQLVQVGRVVLT